jgi:hypothetical protein
MESIEKYVFIGDNGDSDSGIINQPEGWLIITPFGLSLLPMDTHFSAVCIYIYVYIYIYIYEYMVILWNFVSVRICMFMHIYVDYR